MQTSPLAFITTDDSRVNLDGDTLLVRSPASDAITRIPLGVTGAVAVVGRRVECTTASLLALARRGIPCVFVGVGGKPLSLVPASDTILPGLELRRAQHTIDAQRRADVDAGCGLALVRPIIVAKIEAMAAILRQHDRSHDDVELSGPIATLDRATHSAGCATAIRTLRGIEGGASAAYWQAMPALFRGELTTTRRTRRPPRDECNAALSFGYGLLNAEVWCVAEALGFDCALGILHEPCDRRASLPLDLCEPFRHAIIDRLVLRLTNRGELGRNHFESEGEAVYLNADGRRIFLAAYARCMQAQASGPDAEPVDVRGRLATWVTQHAALTKSVACMCEPQEVDAHAV